MGAPRVLATLNRCLQTGTQAQASWATNRTWWRSPSPARRATPTQPPSKPANLSLPQYHNFLTIHTSCNKTTSSTHFHYIKCTLISVFLFSLLYLNHKMRTNVHNNTLVGVYNNRVCSADNLEIKYNFCFYMKNFNYIRIIHLYTISCVYDLRS